ncbi:MAG: histidine kinase [Tannerella sp.]|jgi:hypothetical protein|nr:histidine kinase [Tannerella sp.]
MQLFEKNRSVKLLLISVIGAFFIIYPNIAGLSWDLDILEPEHHRWFFAFFMFRYIFFIVLIWFVLRNDLQRFKTTSIVRHFIRNFIIIALAYLIYIAFSLLIIHFLPVKKSDCFTGVLIFQFFVVGIVCTFLGHIVLLYNIQTKKEQEIEQLKIENLQSRCDALTNQINPHFFFNSLNSLSALIRKKDDDNTLAYINMLSDVFRYILQSEKKGLVKLEKELEFVQAFRYLLEVRYANKLIFNIDVPNEQMNLQIPVLSLLPLIDNIIVHNTIDSEHKMLVTIRLNEQAELVVSNPVFPKITIPDTNGTGIKNLENRFILLMNKQIRIESDKEMFYVYMPLK